MHVAYLNIFKRLGINIIPTVSDNGVIGGSVAEEFQAITNLGEDKLLFDKEYIPKHKIDQYSIILNKYLKDKQDKKRKNK